MDREIVLGVLALWVCGPILLVSGLLLQKRHFWWEVVPAGIAFAVLVGWALQEPATADEGFRSFVYLAIAPIVLVWTRAAVRAVRAPFRSGCDTPAFTAGFIRPRVFLSPLLAAMLDTEARRAVEEHEAAHARHRDPLRIWLARFVTDLSWPWPAASERFERWLAELEIERDDEARSRGVHGADLAAAILAAVQIYGHHGDAGGATLVGDEPRLRIRIERLLEPLNPTSVPHSRARRWRRVLVISATLLLAIAFGHSFGDTAVKALPGVVRLPDPAPVESRTSTSHVSSLNTLPITKRPRRELPR